MNRSNAKDNPNGFSILRKPPIAEATFQMNFALKASLKS